MARPCHLRGGRLRLLLLSKVALSFARTGIEDLHVFFVAHSGWCLFVVLV
jgi:hypothetical protein